jgi:hypothetical protein
MQFQDIERTVIAHKQGWFEVIAGKSVVAFQAGGGWRSTVGEVLWLRANLLSLVPSSEVHSALSVVLFSTLSNCAYTARFGLSGALA